MQFRLVDVGLRQEAGREVRTQRLIHSAALNTHKLTGLLTDE
jgi:hypothetical protein